MADIPTTLPEAIQAVWAPSSALDLRRLLRQHRFHPDLVGAIHAWLEAEAIVGSRGLSKDALDSCRYLREKGHLPIDTPALRVLRLRSRHAHLADERTAALSAMVTIGALTTDDLMAFSQDESLGRLQSRGIEALAAHPAATPQVWAALLTRTDGSYDMAYLLTQVPKVLRHRAFASQMLSHVLARPTLRRDIVLPLLKASDAQTVSQALATLAQRAPGALASVSTAIAPAILALAGRPALTDLLGSDIGPVRQAAIAALGFLDEQVPAPAAARTR